MDGGQTAGGGGAGPAPFLLKTYEMVDDSSTDEIVSWSLTNTSFVVWNPPEFSRLLLPTYFKHNNFSSFIRQLNTYGFRKIDPERWEFANEEFVKDQKHLLKNIHRRKPIHSHSQPHGSFGDAERMALEDEIDRLSREKTTLQNDLWRFQQQQSGTKLQLEELERRVHEMELRQQKMISFLAKAAQNPSFVDNLIQMAGASMDFSAINKKRRLPKVDYGQEVVENVFLDNHSSSSRPELGHIFHLDFSSKLKLELSPAVSDSNLISASVQSSNEDGGSPQGRPSEGSAPKDAYMRAEGFSFAPETLELSDTGTSFLLKKNVPLSRQTRNEGPELHDLRCCSTSAEEEGDDLMSCHLNLTLASSPLQVDNIHYSAKSSNPLGVQDVDTSAELNGREIDHRGVIKNRAFTSIDATMPYSQLAPAKNQAPTGRVNDVFWEQFLTERPGSSDTEEASSSFRVNPCDEQEERKSGLGKSWRSKKDMEQLTL